MHDAASTDAPEALEVARLEDLAAHATSLLRCAVVNEVPITSACLRLEARVAKLLSDAWLAGRVELWRELAFAEEA